MSRQQLSRIAMEWTVALTNMTAPKARPLIDADDTLGDLRFRALMRDDEWASLPAAIQRRFTKRLADGRTTVYTGMIQETRMSRAGWWLAQIARVIGAPLPTSTDSHVPMIVTVTEDVATTGQIWTRLCGRHNGFPQIINSSKRFMGPTGIEEYLGYGIGIAMTVHARDSALVFASERYSLYVLGRRFTLPNWLRPAAMTVVHAELGGGRFIFTLDVTHPLLGLLIHQSAVFQESAGPH
jgi:hypothetical protein